MSTFLNGADVQIGKVYRGPSVVFNAGDVYKSASTGKTYRFCLIEPAINSVIIDGMSLSGTIGGNGNSQPLAAAAAGGFHGVAILSDKGANAAYVGVDSPKTGVWSQIGGNITNANGAFCIPDASTANLKAGAVYIDNGGTISSTTASAEKRSIVGHQGADELTGTGYRNFAAYRATELTDNTGTKVTDLSGFFAVDATLLGTATAQTTFAVAGTVTNIKDGAGKVYGIFADPTTGPLVTVVMSTLDELDSLTTTGSGSSLARGSGATWITGMTFVETTNSTKLNSADIIDSINLTGTA